MTAQKGMKSSQAQSASEKRSLKGRTRLGKARTKWARRRHLRSCNAVAAQANAAFRKTSVPPNEKKTTGGVGGKHTEVASSRGRWLIDCLGFACSNDTTCFAMPAPQTHSGGPTMMPKTIRKGA